MKSRLAIISLLLISSVGVCCKDNIEMNNIQPVIKTLQAIPDEFIIDGEKEKVVDYVYQQLSSIEYHGIAVHLPRVIPEEKTIFPMIITEKEPTERSNEIVLGDNCTLVLQALTTGQHWLLPCFEKPKAKIPLPNKIKLTDLPPLEDAGVVLASHVVNRLELASLLNTELQPGLYSVTVFSYDWYSNTSITQRMGSITTTPVERQKVLDVLSQYNLGGTLSDKFPDCLKSSRHAELTSSAIVVSNSSFVDSDDDQMPIYGSFKIAGISSWQAEAISSEAIGDQDLSQDNIYQNYPIAIVPVKLLLTKIGVLIPTIFSLEVPVFEQAQGVKGKILEGYFSVNLLDYLDQGLETGTYQLYVLVGNLVSSPQTITITEND